MDYYFLKSNSTASSQTLPEESVACIAVKEDRHQNMMSSMVLKKGIEEPWASERVGRFINSSGYKEITLQSDTGPATIAFRNRVAENCKAEVALEDAVIGDKLSNGLVANAVMLLRGVITAIECHVESCTQEELREASPILPWLVEHAESIFVQGARSRDGRRSLRNHCRTPLLQRDHISTASTTHSDPCRVRIEERLKMTPEGSERLDRRSEAHAKEVERNVRRREEVGSAAGELAVPREPKDLPIPLDSDSGKRRALKAATVEASSGRSQLEGSGAVADESRMDVEGEERRRVQKSTESNIRRRIVAKTGGEEGDGFRSSTAPNTRRRIVTHHWKSTEVVRERWQ